MYKGYQGLGCSLSHYLSSFLVSAIQEQWKEPEDTMQFQDDELSYALGKQASLSAFMVIKAVDSFDL